MNSLDRTLNQFFKPLAGKKMPNEHIAAGRRFKRLSIRQGFSYVRSRDGYIEIKPTVYWPNGLITYFIDWTDALARIERCLVDPGLCADGEYSE